MVLYITELKANFEPKLYKFHCHDTKISETSFSEGRFVSR